jgi:hypothetical protein
LAASEALAQGADKKNEQGAFLMLLVPLGIFTAASFQIATLAVAPRFARRCAAAVRRYTWRAGLLGLAGLLAVFALAAVLGSVGAGGTGGLLFAVVGGLAGTAGGVGVSLQAGEWALRRIGGDAHPLLVLLAGSCVLGWAVVLLPVVGQLLWIVVACLAMGAFWLALILGRSLDEAPARPTPAPTTVSPEALPVAGPPAAAASPAPAAPPADDSQVF